MFKLLQYYTPALFFLTLFIFSLRRSRTRFLSNGCINYSINYIPLLLIGLYCISAFLIGFVDEENWYPYFHESSYTFQNFLIYSILISIYLIPALYLRPLVSINQLQKSRIVTYIMIIMSVMGWYAFIYLLPYAIKGLSIGALDLRREMNMEQVYLLPSSPLTTLAVGTAHFCIFYIVFFFIALIQKRHFLIKISLFIGSISYIISGLTFTTRDVFVFYIFNLIFVYLYFNFIIPNKLKKKLKFFIVISGVVLIALLLIFSFQRFLNSERSELSWGTIGYIAPQPFVFSETVEQQRVFYNGDLRFPVFKFIFTLENPLRIERRFNYETMFGTFIKDLYSEGGYKFLFLFTIFFVSFFYLKFKYSDNNFYRKLILSTLYFQFISEGIFYINKLGASSGNLYIIILLFFYMATYVKLRSSALS